MVVDHIEPRRPQAFAPLATPWPGLSTAITSAVFFPHCDHGPAAEFRPWWRQRECAQRLVEKHLRTARLRT